MATKIEENIREIPDRESDEAQTLLIPPHSALSFNTLVPGPQHPIIYGKNIVDTYP